MFTPNPEIVTSILPDATEVSEVKLGGQKAVYKAICGQHGQVVVKILLPDVSIDRLMREIKIVSENNFPNVPRILDKGQIEAAGKNVLYIVEPYINGSDLRAVLNSQGSLPIPDAFDLLSSLFDTVTALEEKGIVHRDIK